MTEPKDMDVPSYGPDWDAAIAYGIDVSLLEHNLSLTPTERLEQLQQMSELYELLRPPDGDSADP
ncbi:MAG: hypothetical protein M3Y59_23685 [Myxococcota bacterium]|nr:hypothetical protein [Myxococcota bacterium]